MCGHVGIAGDLEYKDEATFRRLLMFDWLRGQDSTGVATLSKKNHESKIAKIDSHPPNLFETERFKKAVTGSSSSVFLGHNRAATLGKVSEVNAHPFRTGHIVGAHNGTLDKASWERLLKLAEVENTGTDSEAIFLAIEKVGVEKTIEAMETGSTAARGAWALVWIDEKENTLNFLRNKHRPMWYAYTDDFKKLFWSSEYAFIRAAISSEAAKDLYKLHVQDTYSFFQMEEDWWYRFDLEELIKGSDKPYKPKVKQVTGRPPTVTSVISYSGGNYAHNDPFPSHSTTKIGTHSHGSTKNKGGGDTAPAILDLMGTSTHPLSVWMSKKRFDELAKYGCSYCQADIEYEEPGVVIYDTRDIILCPECSGHSDHSRVYLTPDELDDIYKMTKTMN